MTNLTPKELERYSRQIQLPGLGEDGQKALKNTTALISGVGGLGGTVALYLAVAGIGKLILVRGGELRLDDMNRQILMTDDSVGKSRVIKARETLAGINPDVEIEAIAEYITPENVDALVQRSDLALSCAHNFPERDLPGVWLTIEIWLNLMGLDNIADYSEFIFTQDFDLKVKNRKTVKIIEQPPQFCFQIDDFCPIPGTTNELTQLPKNTCNSTTQILKNKCQQLSEPCIKIRCLTSNNS